MFKIPGVLLCCAMFSLQVCAQAGKDTTQFDLRIDGSQKFQPIDGIGVNVNTRSWNGTELQEAIELLHDSMNAAVWRVVSTVQTTVLSVNAIAQPARQML